MTNCEPQCGSSQAPVWVDEAPRRVDVDDAVVVGAFNRLAETVAGPFHSTLHHAARDARRSADHQHHHHHRHNTVLYYSLCLSLPTYRVRVITGWLG